MEQSHESVRENIVTNISRHRRLKAEIEELGPTFQSLAQALCRNQADAEDLMQELMAVTFANLDRFPDGMSLKSWMFENMYDSFRRKFDISK